MKSKILSIVLIVGIAAALIGGLTMAWFTDNAEVASAKFTAGTVSVSADGPSIVSPPEKHFKNVNPGDCATVIWKIRNIGTKAVALRVKLSKTWEDGLSPSNVFYSPLPNSGWKMYDNGGELILYYTGSVRGTFNYDNPDGDPLDPAEVELKLVVAFDGLLTGNNYQGKEFTLGGTVEAIQASNNAPATVWGATGWTAVNTAGYEEAGSAKENADYFRTGPGKDMPCWDAEEPEMCTITAVANPEEGGTVSGSGTYEKGTEITLSATANEGYNFVNWTRNGTEVSTNASFDITVTGNADYTANFEPIPKYKVTVSTSNGGPYYPGGWYASGTAIIQGDGISGTFEEGTQVTITATPGLWSEFAGWYKGSYAPGNLVDGAGATYTFTVTEEVTYVARFVSQWE
jgi:predicted ribosomally synthesized peptide with SipW-like signal peptide/uncharacterized repeat protein (TIGR02543 family)